MDEWEPIVVLPNLDMRGKIECEYAAIVALSDDRVCKLRDAHPEGTLFLSKFFNQFREQVSPSLLLMRSDAPGSYRTPEAITAFRDIISLSVAPHARAARLRYNRANALAFTNTFQFYPWMLTATYEGISLQSPNHRDVNLLDNFEGQSFPEQPQASVMEPDVDFPLAKRLLERWTMRFSQDPAEWKDRALFRSLNMANEAASVPANTAMTFYDVGRSLALWVSAYEIWRTREATAGPVSQPSLLSLRKVKWRSNKLSEKVRTIDGKPPQQVQLAAWICKRVYDLRNDFLHGNDVDGRDLFLSGNTMIDYAACLYRPELTGFLGLQFKQDVAETEDAEATTAYRAERARFNKFYKFQEAYESAFLTAV
jgi:hypothetical protein